MARQFILVTGGARSGKSRYAVELAKRLGPSIVYLATCAASDPEMRRRIARHRRARPASWTTIESPTNPAAALGRLPQRTHGVIIDCLTLLVSQLMLAKRSDAAIEAGVTSLCEAIRRAPCPVIVVTNEVGNGVVPASALGRRFRDLAGTANQIAAAAADEVYLLVAGLPLCIKSHSAARQLLTTLHVENRR